MPPDSEPLRWSEENSLDYLDTGRYFVPDRQEQIDTICALVPQNEQPAVLLELCCGEGLLAEALLKHDPACRVIGLDGSAVMLEHARQKLAAYGERFEAHFFELGALDWRKTQPPLRAVISSLAIHHLDGAEKQALFRDIHQMLLPGGVLVIADLVQPASLLGQELAAEAWTASVRQQNLALDGNTQVFDQFHKTEWNIFSYPDPMDKPSAIFEQLRWLEQAGFQAADVYWMKAGHAIYGAQKARP